MVFLLSPVAGPANKHSVVLKPAEAPRLNQVGHAISQVGRNDYLAEAFHFLCLHQAPDGLRWQGSEKDQPELRPRPPWPRSAPCRPYLPSLLSIIPIFLKLSSDRVIPWHPITYGPYSLLLKQSSS